MHFTFGHHLLLQIAAILYTDITVIQRKRLKRQVEKKTKIGFHDQLSLNAGQTYCRMLQGEHSAILSTFIKLLLVIKIFALIGFTVSFLTRNILKFKILTSLFS